MDEQYIKMCNCPEIQDKWEPKVGDRTDCGIITNIINRESIIVYYDRSGHFPEFGFDELKWLPSQEQLQGMLLTPSIGHYELVENFWDFVWGLDNEADLESNEEGEYLLYRNINQLWLAFVMYELHDKKWEERGWTSE